MGTLFWPLTLCKLCKPSFSEIPKFRQVKSSNEINEMRGVAGNDPPKTRPSNVCKCPSADETESKNGKFLPHFVSLNFQVGFAFNDSETFTVSKYLITCRLLCLEALTARLSLFCLTTERVATSRETSSKTLHSCLDMFSLSFNKHLRRFKLAPLRQLLKDAL